MNNLLIVYGTSEGQTAKIAGRIADVAKQRGLEVDVQDAGTLPSDFSFDSYHAVLVGASLHMARYQRCIRDFVRRRRAELERLPSAFFSVSLWEAFPTPATRAQLDRAQQRFFEETGWQPRVIASFGGALAYRRYGFLMRKRMQVVTWIFGRQLGQPTDASRDYEYTDWDAVTRFADNLAAQLMALPTTPALAPTMPG